MAKTDKEKILDLKEKLKQAKAECKFLTAAYKRMERERYHYKDLYNYTRKDLIRCNEEKNSGLNNWENPGRKF